MNGWNPRGEGYKGKLGVKQTGRCHQFKCVPRAPTAVVPHICLMNQIFVKLPLLDDWGGAWGFHVTFSAWNFTGGSTSLKQCWDGKSAVLEISDSYEKRLGGKHVVDALDSGHWSLCIVIHFLHCRVNIPQHQVHLSCSPICVLGWHKKKASMGSRLHGQVRNIVGIAFCWRR